jgi:predicted RNA-binding protein YlxR (DUF448 family)
VRKKDGPYRQCVSCRGVFRKEELLRFVQDSRGRALFDGRQNRPGRGYYLCPEQGCFLSAWKNKRARTLFRDEVEMKRLVNEVMDTLAGSAEAALSLPVEGCVLMDPDTGPQGMHDAAALLVSEDLSASELAALHIPSGGQGVRVFRLTSDMLKGSRCLMIPNPAAKSEPLLRNLRFYERLSSKGRVL